MILIADSGSTKTDWVLLDDNNSFRYKTIGYNPYFSDTERIYESVNEKLCSQFEAAEVSKVWFYGAGCLEADKIAVVEKALTRNFSKAEVHVGHDMLGAARALLGNSPGFAAILGTGSNTCLYDGEQVIKNIDSVGYLLGDEGSGGNIGKRLLRDYMRGYLPKALSENFREAYPLSNSEFFDALYNKPLPNRFLAGFCLFADKHREHEYIRKIVYDAFSDFFRNLVTHYENYQEHQFNCIGSVGYIFRDILKDVAEFNGMETGRIIHTPIEDLVNYHRTFSQKALQDEKGIQNSSR